MMDVFQDFEKYEKLLLQQLLDFLYQQCKKLEKDIFSLVCHGNHQTKF